MENPDNKTLEWALEKENKKKQENIWKKSAICNQQILVTRSLQDGQMFIRFDKSGHSVAGETGKKLSEWLSDELVLIKQLNEILCWF